MGRNTKPVVIVFPVAPGTTPIEDLPLPVREVSSAAIAAHAGAACRSLLDPANAQLYVPDNHGQFRNLQAGERYTAILDIPPPAPQAKHELDSLDLVRAEVGLEHQRALEARTDATRLTTEAPRLGILRVIRTREHADFPCHILVCTDAVIVCVDLRPTQIRAILGDATFNAIPGLPDDCRANATALALAGALPLETLIQLCHPDEASASHESSTVPRSGTASPHSSEGSSLRRLVLSGHGVSGALAHLAAVVVRHTARRLADDELHVHAFATGAGSLVNTQAALAINDRHLSEHLSLVLGGDCMPRLTMLCLMLGGIPGPIRAEICPGLTDVLLQLASQPVHNIHTHARQLDEAQVQAASRLLEESDYRRIEPMVFGNYGFLEDPHAPTFVIDPDQAFDELMAADVYLANVRKHSRSLAWPSPPTDVLAPDASAMPFPLTPVIRACHVVATSERMDLRVEGENLEAILGRTSLNGQELHLMESPPGESLPVAPLILAGGDLFRPSAGGVSQVIVRMPTALDGAKFVLMGLEVNDDGHAPCQLLIQTDFGVSTAIEITRDNVNVGQDLDPSSLLHNTAGYDILREAFARFVVLEHARLEQGGQPFSRPPAPSLKPQPTHAMATAMFTAFAATGMSMDGGSAAAGTAGSPVMRPSSAVLSLLDDLFAIEALMLGTHTLESEVKAFASNPTIERAKLTMNVASRELNRVANKIATPLQLDVQSGVSRFLRRVLARLGQFAGAVFMVAAVVAAVPAAVLAAPATLLFNREAAEQPIHTSTGLALIPASIAALPAAAIGLVGMSLLRVAAASMRDQPSRQYLAVMELVLHIFDQPTTNVLEELTSLEDALCAYWRTTYGKELHETSLGEIQQALQQAVEAQRQDKSHPAHIVASKHARVTLSSHIKVMGHFHRLRHTLGSNLMVTFVGVHNAGKSTCINRLFDIDTRPDMLTRTELPGVYALDPSRYRQDQSTAADAATSATPELAVHVVDMPGADDEHEHVADMTARFGYCSTLFICVFAAGHIAGAECKIVNDIKRMNKPFLVFINQCDRINDLHNNLSAFRSTYALTLNVPESIIIFTSMRDAMDVDNARCILYASLAPFVKENLHGALANMLLHPKFRREAAQIVRGHLQQEGDPIDRALEQIAECILENELPCHPNNVQHALSHLQELQAQHRTAVTRQESVDRRHTALIQFLKGLVQDLSVDANLANALIEQAATIVDDTDAWASAHAHLRDVLDVWVRARAAPADGMLMVLFSFLEPMSTLMQSATIKREELTGAGLDLAPGVEFEALFHWLLEPERLDPPSAFVSEAQALQQKKLDQSLRSETSLSLQAPMLITFGRARLMDQLRITSAFSIGKPSQPRDYYTAAELEAGASFEERHAIFKAHLERYQAANPFEGLEVGIPVSETQLCHDFLLGLSSEAITVNQLRHGRLTVSMVESANTEDVGGVLRSVITQCALTLTDGDSPFAEVEPGVVYFRKKPVAQMDDWLRGLGRLLGLAVCRDDVLFPVPFPLALFKLLLGQTLRIEDLEAFRPTIVASVKCIGQMNELDDMGLTFSVDDDTGDDIELMEDGANVAVTRFNRNTYLRLFVEYYLGRHLPLLQLVRGFHDACPAHLACIFSPGELQQLVRGKPDIDVQDMIENMRVASPRPDAATLDYFVTVLGELTPEQCSKFLIFTTGNAVPPVHGFATMHPPLSVSGSHASLVDSLLVSHTCFNSVELPRYTSLEVCREKVLFSISNVNAADLGRW